MVRNTYVYKEKEFHSIKDLAKFVGKNEKTITARLRKGMTIEEACDPVDLRCVYYEENGGKKSIIQICNEQAKNEYLVRNRLNYGYTMNEALNKPKKVTKQGSPIVVNGILYNSISSALRKLNLTHKESTIRRKLKQGIEPNDAFQPE